MTSPLQSWRPGSCPLSIVTAAYNAGYALEATIVDVAKKNDGRIEHIVIDGGSNDGSAEYLARTSTRWISEPDQGIADAMNKGIALAEGDYVLILQAGDVLSPDADFEEIFSQLDGSDIVSFDVLVTHQLGDVHFRSRGFGGALERSMSVPHQGAFVRRELYEQIGAFDPQYKVGMDYEFMLRAKRAGATCKVVNQIIARMPADGVSARRDWPSLEKRLAENRRIQAVHSRGWVDRLVQSIYWSIYPHYKRLRHMGGRR